MKAPEPKPPRPKSVKRPAVPGTYGECIKAKRLELGLIQKYVAEIIGVDETTVYNWETGRAVPAVRLLPRIIRLLGYCPCMPGLTLTGKLKM